MISIGARNDTGQLFARKTAVKRRNENFAGLQSEDASSDVSYFRFSSMHSSKERLGAEKSGWIRWGQSVSSPLTMWMFISWQFPADRVVAVNIPVTVHEILHITAILFAVDFDLLEINCFCFGKQGEKFFRHVLCRFNVMRVFVSLKKREGLCQLLSCRFTFYWFIIIYHHKGMRHPSRP